MWQLKSRGVHNYGNNCFLIWFEILTLKGQHAISSHWWMLYFLDYETYRLFLVSSGHRNPSRPNQDVADTFKKLKFQQLPQTQASEICSLHCHPLREQWAAAGPHSGNYWLIQTPSPIRDAEYQAGRPWAPFLSSLMWPSRGLNPQPPSHNVDIIPPGCSLSENQKWLKNKQTKEARMWMQSF